MIFTRRQQHRSSPPAPAAPRTVARGRATVLREFSRADVDRWLAWPRHTDPLFESYNAPLFNERQRDSYFNQYLDSPSLRQYSVFDPQEEFVGRISIREIDWRLCTSVLGVSFHPTRLNQGYGSDAMAAFLGYYFGPLRMNVLFLDVAAFNHRARRVYEKLGFRTRGERWGEAQTDYAGVFRKHEYQPIRHLFRWDAGLVRPLLVDMMLSREDWLRLQQSAPPPPPDSPR